VAPACSSGTCRRGRRRGRRRSAGRGFLDGHDVDEVRLIHLDGSAIPRRGASRGTFARCASQVSLPSAFPFTSLAYSGPSPEYASDVKGKADGKLTWLAHLANVPLEAPLDGVFDVREMRQPGQFAVCLSLYIACVLRTVPNYQAPTAPAREPARQTKRAASKCREGLPRRA
jgi:hypothetical protein